MHHPSASRQLKRNSFRDHSHVSLYCKTIRGLLHTRLIWAFYHTHTKIFIRKHRENAKESRCKRRRHDDYQRISHDEPSTTKLSTIKRDSIRKKGKAVHKHSKVMEKKKRSYTQNNIILRKSSKKSHWEKQESLQNSTFFSSNGIILLLQGN